MGAEPDPAADEEEAGSAREPAIAIWTPFVSRTVNPEIVVIHEPFRVGQDHDTDDERSESELIRGEDLTSPTNGTTAMTQTKLGGDDQDVWVALGFRDLLHHLFGLGELTNVFLINLPFAVVVQRTASLFDEVEDLMHALAVCRANRRLTSLLPDVGDGEPSFGIGGKHDRAIFDLFEEVEVGIAETGDKFPQTIALLGDPLRLVAGEVAVVRGGFFVGEPIRNREFDNLSDHELAQALREVGISLETLSTLFVEFAESVLNRIRLSDIADDPCDEPFLTVGYLSKRIHVSSSFLVVDVVVWLAPGLRRAS